jgi:hypothetical protein
LPWPFGFSTSANYETFTKCHIVVYCFQGPIKLTNHVLFRPKSAFPPRYPPNSLSSNSISLAAILQKGECQDISIIDLDGEAMTIELPEGTFKERRSGIERRQYSYTAYIPERRCQEDRREDKESISFVCIGADQVDTNCEWVTIY